MFFHPYMDVNINIHFFYIHLQSPQDVKLLSTIKYEFDNPYKPKVF